MGRYINFYIANGAGTPVEKTRQFQGTLENVNVQNVPGVGHISIEKNQIMQQKVISAIDCRRLRPIGTRFGAQKPRQAGAASAVRTGTARTVGGTPSQTAAGLVRTAGRRSDECRKFCQFLDDRSSAERWVARPAGIHGPACLYA